METSLYINTDRVQFACGSAGNKGVVVDAFGTVPLPPETVINGIILNEGVFKDAVARAVELSPLTNFEKLRVCIGGSSAMFKVREIPNMGEDKVLEWMKGEFASEDQLEEEELIYDYATIAPGPEGGQTALLCAIKKSILEQYIRLLGDLEITISCIDVGIASQVKLLNRMKEAEGKTFIMLYLIGNNLDASLYVDGVLKIFVRSRLLYDRGSSGFEEELAQNISKMIQFNKSEGRDGAIDSIYLAGFSQEKDWIQAQQEGGFAIPLKELSEAAAGEVTCNDGEFSINDYMCAVGNLIRE